MWSNAKVGHVAVDADASLAMLFNICIDITLLFRFSILVLTLTNSPFGNVVPHFFVIASSSCGSSEVHNVESSFRSAANTGLTHRHYLGLVDCLPYRCITSTEGTWNPIPSRAILHKRCTSFQLTTPNRALLLASRTRTVYRTN